MQATRHLIFTIYHIPSIIKHYEILLKIKFILYMRCIYRNSAGSEAKHGQKGSNPVKLCDLAELFRDLAEL